MKDGGINVGDHALMDSFRAGAPLTNSEMTRLIALGWIERTDVFVPRWGRYRITRAGLEGLLKAIAEDSVEGKQN